MNRDCEIIENKEVQLGCSLGLRVKRDRSELRRTGAKYCTEFFFNVCVNDGSDAESTTESTESLRSRIEAILCVISVLLLTVSAVFVRTLW